ncbi:MAG: hypothetical protein ABF899_01485 [Oenococcus sp.]|uniref:hypothetical protein n=1 Tax=Oenococcus sp. TaxID=1979414 RepID=UPI0039E996E9
MDNEELTNKYYELASKVGELTVEIAELKKASHKSEAPKRIESGTIDADSIKFSGTSFIDDASVTDRGN